MLKSYFFIFSLVVVCMYCARAQGDEQTTVDPQDYGRINHYFTPPTTAKFHEVSFSEPEYSTGKVKYLLPVYAVDLDGLNIPIALTYFSNGIQIHSIASRVGQEWTLQAGGCVTRQVRGNLYDFMYEYSDAVGEIKGWHYTSADEAKDVKSIVTRYDGEPDLMVADAPGLHSEFVIDKEGNPVVVDGQNIKLEYEVNLHIEEADAPIQFSGVYILDNDICDIEKMTITNDKGYVYTFDYLAWSMKSIGLDVRMGISSWYLTSIKSPTGNTIKYTYDSNGKMGVVTVASGVLAADSTDYYNSDIYYETTKGNVHDAWENFVSLTNRVRLKNIAFPKGNISFTYGFDRSEELEGDSALSQIYIKNYEGSPIERVNLNYSYFNHSAGDNSRLKLDQVVITSPSEDHSKAYNFTYYSGNVPDRGSYEYDYGGFYNSNGATTFKSKLYAYYSSDISQTRFYPFLMNNNYVVLDSDGADRSPTIASKNGLLKRVDTPTGGFKEFYYELNEWQGYKIPGLRLAKEILFDGNDSTSINYSYSAAYVDFPKLACLIDTRNGMTDSEKKVFIKNYTTRFVMDQFNNDFYNGSKVLYANVKAYQSGNGYIEYAFQIPNDPSVSYDQNSFYTTINPPSGFPFFSGESYKYRRGKLVEKGYFDKNDVLKRVEVYHYNLIPSSESITAYVAKRVNHQYYYGTGGIYNDIYIRGYYVLHSGTYNQTVEVEGFPEDTVTSDMIQIGDDYDHIMDDQDSHFNTFLKKKDFYTYDTSFLLKKHQTIRSDRDTVTTLFRYPTDLDEMVYSGMVDSNMINYPVEEIKLKGDAIISGQLTTYKEWGNSYVPDKVYRLNIADKVMLSSYDYYNGTSLDQHYDPLPEVSFDEYTERRGNVAQVTMRDGVTTSYLWDYNENYPLAELKNCTYDKISSVQPLSGDSTITQSPLLYARLSELVPSAEVSTYSYIPLVGMTSSTAPNGVTTYYEYDEFGRLKNVRNDDGNVTSRNFYHYYNETTADGPTLSLDKSSMSFTYSAGSSTFTISSNCSWSISDNASWLTVSPTSGSGDGTITVTVSKNSTSSTRTATITITYGPANQTKAITVSQKSVPTLSLSSSSLSVYLDKFITINVSSNTSWTISMSSSLSSWLVITDGEDDGDPENNITSGSGNKTLYFTAYSFASSFPSGTVYFKTSDGTVSASLTVRFN